MKPSLRPTFRIVGTVLMAVAITMVPVFAVALICGELREGLVFIILAAVVFFLGYFMRRKCRRRRNRNELIHIADGLLIVVLSWIIVSIIGAIPYMLIGAVENPIDAFFESCSGFTTTGATALTSINHLPRCLLFWRSMTCWAGGIGILLLGIALMPALGLNAQRLTVVDSHGPTLDALTPKMIASVRVITLVYLVMTIVETILLTLGGMTLFNGLLHSMSTVSTGGFSRYDQSIGHFDSTYIRTVILCFMILSGVNFELYVRAVRGGLRAFAGNTELKLYGFFIVLGSMAITTFLLLNDTYGSTTVTVSNALFQTVSVITTTGFTTTYYMFWPVVCHMILVLLMFMGACSSSPGGGIKLVRVAVILKLIRHGLSMRLHPRFFETVMLNKQGLPGDKVSGAVTIPFLYLTALFAGVFLLIMMNNPLPESFSAGLSCLTNTGAGFGGAGSGSIYTIFDGPSKLILSILMIGGRLELYALLVLIIPKYWTKDY